MPKNIDTRDFSFSRASSSFADADAVSDSLPGEHRVAVERVNKFTGSTDNLQSSNAPVAFEAVPGQPPGSIPTGKQLISQEH